MAQIELLEEKIASAQKEIKETKNEQGSLDALKEALDEAAFTNGPISVLVNNAANDTRHTLADYTVTDFDKNIAVNLRPHFFTAQTVAAQMRKMGGGSIINLSLIHI